METKAKKNAEYPKIVFRAHDIQATNHRKEDLD